MTKQKVKYRSLREELRAKPEIAKLVVADIQKAIDMHRLVLEGLVDAVVWRGISYKRAGGATAMEVAMEGFKKNSEKYKQLRIDLNYWNINYAEIQRYIFTGEDIKIS